MRAVFLGNAAWSVPSLEALAGSSHHVLRVVTRTPKPAGRGGRLASTPVAAAARALGLPLAEVATVKVPPGFDALTEGDPEVLVVVAYGEILPPQVLEVPSVMPVNVHFSLLPELRGAAPVQRAILEGLAATGVSTMRMDRGMDTGPVLLQATEAIDPLDDAGSLGSRLAAIGGALLVETLGRMERGGLREERQDQARATLAPKIGPADERIDWDEAAVRIERRVRALAPTPAARTQFRGAPLKILRVSALGEADSTSRLPGSLRVAQSGTPVVAAGVGEVALEEVLPAGRRRMSGAEFARGFRPEPDERLG